MESVQWQAIGKKSNKQSTLPEWFEAAAYSAAAIVVLFLFVVRIILVSGPSMLPTLQDNDRIAVQSFFYTPKHGDVVVIDGLTEYGKPLVKRIIGVEGDEIFIDEASGELFVNGEKRTESYIEGQTYPIGDLQYPITVPSGKVFVLGDNRTSSLDSRSAEIGMPDERDILGKVLACLLPIQNAGVIK